MHAEEVGNKRFIAFVQDRLMEGKKSFLEPICKVKLKTGSKKKKKVLKSLSVLKENYKEDCQAFGLFVNKTEKLAEAFKYPITSVPLAVATLYLPKSTLYQSDKAGLRNSYQKVLVTPIQEMLSGSLIKWWQSIQYLPAVLMRNGSKHL